VLTTMLPASISSNASLASTKARRQSRFMLTIRVRQTRIRFDVCILIPLGKPSAQ
jgi:hypothetical protein